MERKASLEEELDNLMDISIGIFLNPSSIVVSNRDGKMCGYCGYIRAIFFFSCANFLAAYAQTNHKHCAVLDCAKSN